MASAEMQSQDRVASPRLSADRVREILIVDDHPLMCDALALTLKISFGLRNVRTARSLAAALEQIRNQGAPDAVILDLNLPDARGAEGLVTLRRQIPDVPITMISADLENAMISAAMAAGAQGYISKSLGREALAALRSELKKSEQRVAKLEEMRSKLAKKLADPELYEADRKGDLGVWNAKYAEVMEALDRAEALWMKAAQAIEEAEKEMSVN